MVAERAGARSRSASARLVPRSSRSPAVSLRRARLRVRERSAAARSAEHAVEDGVGDRELGHLRAARPRRPSGRAARPGCRRPRSRCPARLTSLATRRSMPLAPSLARALAPHVVGLGGEAHQEGAALARGQLPEDVGVRHQLEREPLVLPRLDLWSRWAACHAIVRHRRRLDHDGRRWAGAGARPRASPPRSAPGRRRRRAGGVERGGARDQDHLGAAAERGGGDGVAHLPGRAVGEIAHGIDGLARGPRGHQDAARRRGRARGREEPLQRLDDGVRLGQPPLAR